MMDMKSVSVCVCGLVFKERDSEVPFSVWFDIFDGAVVGAKVRCDAAASVKTLCELHVPRTERNIRVGYVSDISRAPLLLWRA